MLLIFDWDGTLSDSSPKIIRCVQEAANGYIMTVATGKSRRGLNRVLQNLGLENFFHGSRCADETASKPHPLMLTELLEEWDTPPARAIMVGDTESDMEMAQKAEVHRVAVSYGAHEVDRLLKYQPRLVVNAFSEFLNWIDKIDE